MHFYDGYPTRFFDVLNTSQGDEYVTGRVDDMLEDLKAHDEVKHRKDKAFSQLEYKSPFQ